MNEPTIASGPTIDTLHRAISNADHAAREAPNPGERKDAEADAINLRAMRARESRRVIEMRHVQGMRAAVEWALMLARHHNAGGGKHVAALLDLGDELRAREMKLT